MHVHAQVRTYDRHTPLVVEDGITAGTGKKMLECVQPGDAFITFGRVGACVYVCASSFWGNWRKAAGLCVLHECSRVSSCVLPLKCTDHR